MPPPNRAVNTGAKNVPAVNAGVVAWANRVGTEAGPLPADATVLGYFSLGFGVDSGRQGLLVLEKDALLPSLYIENLIDDGILKTYQKIGELGASAHRPHLAGYEPFDKMNSLEHTKWEMGIEKSGALVVVHKPLVGRGRGTAYRIVAPEAVQTDSQEGKMWGQPASWLGINARILGGGMQYTIQIDSPAAENGIVEPSFTASVPPNNIFGGGNAIPINATFASGESAEDCTRTLGKAVEDALQGKAYGVTVDPEKHQVSIQMFMTLAPINNG
jgi:hypothetical protein